MNPKARMYLIRNSMAFGYKYSLSQLYQIYSNEMNQDYYLENSVKVTQKTIRNQLSSLANDESWLSFESGLYFKTPPRCVFAEAHDKIIKLTKWGKAWIKRLKVLLMKLISNESY